MQCRKCKEADASPAEVGKVGQLVSLISPLVRYKCGSGECGKSFWWRDEGALWTKARIISASVFGLLFLIGLLFALLGGGSGEPLEESPETAEVTADASDSGSEEALPGGTQPENDLLEATDEQVAEAALPKAETSEFVKDRLEKNLQKAGLEPEPEKASPDPQPNPSPNVSAGPASSPAASSSVSPLKVRPKANPSSAAPKPKAKAKPKANVFNRIYNMRPHRSPDVTFFYVKANGPIQRYDKKRWGNKIVIDLPGQWKIDDDVTRDFPVNTRDIDSIRVGLHDDKLRIVLDMEKDSFAEADIRTVEQGLTLSIK